MPYSPLPGGVEPGAGVAVPGTVGVPGQAAVRAGRAVDAAAVQGHLRDALAGAHVQLLLEEGQRMCVRGGRRRGPAAADPGTHPNPD